MLKNVLDLLKLTPFTLGYELINHPSEGAICHCFVFTSCSAAAK